MSRLAYDDPRTVHAESGDWVAFPCADTTRDLARMEMAELTGLRFIDIRCRKGWLKLETDPERVPSGYDDWWTTCSKDDPAAVAFWVCE